MIAFDVEDIKLMGSSIAQLTEYLNARDVDADDVFDSRLVASELIANVLKHCGGTACFFALLTEKEIMITVSATKNPKSDIYVPDLPSVLSESGRGLYIVNAVANGNIRFSDGDVIVTLTRRKK